MSDEDGRPWVLYVARSEAEAVLVGRQRDTRQHAEEVLALAAVVGESLIEMRASEEKGYYPASLVTALRRWVEALQRQAEAEELVGMTATAGETRRLAADLVADFGLAS